MPHLQKCRRKREEPTDSTCNTLSKRPKTYHSRLQRARAGQEPSVSSCPFTNDFFIDMAAAISQLFPIDTFAKAHRCDRTDILDALSAVVLAPLQEPLSWHGAESVSDYGQILIADWRASQGRTGPLGHQNQPITVSDDDEDSLPQSNSPGVISDFTERLITPVSADDDPGNLMQARQDQPAILQKPPGCQKSPVTRVEARLDLWGRYVPVDKWIEGVHKQRHARSDEMTDEQFVMLLQEGWFEET
ncbi:uncharacterized protein N7459_008023 [Penicillium hispanicum]|uniref:uncharacterized protein n=1 Tax=Penicillium hispanicum TaxID=1080232 RepID=UPI002541C4C1|nr:uncharacterized protein N7459_008023 [Penicillium hispanicum]KAJ5573596.1 hypothetical protein N7459_008023 [Penicillium hispanicum]